VSQKAALQLRERIARGRWRWPRAVLPGVCAVLLALAGEAAASDAGLTLETGSPDALCPALPAAREAVERRLGTLVVESGAGWRARYTIAHAPEGAQMDFVRLELFAPDGALQLSRDLPLEAGACSTVAEAIALVLDRYFRKLPVGEAAVEPSPAAAGLEPTPNVSVAPALAVPAMPAPAPMPAPIPLAPVAPLALAEVQPPAAAPGVGEAQTFWRVGAAFATGTAAGPEVSLQLLRESWPHVYTGLELSLDWSSGSQRWLDGAEVSARSLGGALSVGWGTRWGALRGYVGPSVRLSWERASASGMAQNLERDRARTAAGLLLGMVAALGRHWSLSVTTGAEATLGAGEFRVDRREVLQPALLDGRLALGLGYASGQ
jgi:hypothetical protein